MSRYDSSVRFSDAPDSSDDSLGGQYFLLFFFYCDGTMSPSKRGKFALWRGNLKNSPALPGVPPTPGDG